MTAVCETNVSILFKNAALNGRIKRYTKKESVSDAKIPSVVFAAPCTVSELHKLKNPVIDNTQYSDFIDLDPTDIETFVLMVNTSLSVFNNVKLVTSINFFQQYQECSDLVPNSISSVCQVGAL
jgi:hypothetical protein